MAMVTRCEKVGMAYSWGELELLQLVGCFEDCFVGELSLSSTILLSIFSLDIHYK